LKTGNAIPGKTMEKARWRFCPPQPPERLVAKKTGFPTSEAPAAREITKAGSFEVRGKA